MKTDILCITAHPDDVELGAGGTVAASVVAGKHVAIVDLTKGELGTRGDPELRKQEANRAAEILGVAHRDILDLGDGLFEETEANLRTVVERIRYYRPDIVITNALKDRHPDHGLGAKLVSRACFLAGLPKFKAGESEAWRPRAVYFMIQDHYARPDFVVDISQHYEKKMEAIMSFSSQFHDPNSTEPETKISSPDFFHFLEARAREMGRIIGMKYGEGFNVERAPGVKEIGSLL